MVSRQSTPTARPPEPPHILVVEDDPDIRHLLHDVLTDAGYAVAAAPDGEAALRAAAHRTPDAVILDLLLPGVTGWEVAGRFSAQAGRPVPVIVTTAATATLFRLPPDVTRVIPKPFDPDALVAAVEAALSSAQTSDQVRARHAA